MNWQIGSIIAIFSVLLLAGCSRSSQEIDQSLPLVESTPSQTPEPSLKSAPDPTSTPNGTAYYISPQGNDSNLGTQSAPWQTIDRANRSAYQSGDQILFLGGATFNGTLKLGSNSGGTQNFPITISSYGNGQAVINAGNQDGIDIINTQGIVIQNLVLLGSGYSTNQGAGINYNNQTGNQMSGLTITNLNVSGFGLQGIMVLASGGAINNISISNSSVHDNGVGGIEMSGLNNNIINNVYVGNVSSYHNAGSTLNQYPYGSNSGYGIMLAVVSHGVVERSDAHDNGWLPGNYGETGGIVAIGCDHILFQYNESYLNHQGASDGNGFVFDVISDSIMQFNYSHDNDGSGLFLGSEPTNSSRDNVARFNISQNDGLVPKASAVGGIFIWGNTSNLDIYNNTVFMSTSTQSPLAFINATGTSISLRNNIFATQGSIPIVAYFSGSGNNALLLGNDYWNYDSKFQFIWNGSTYSSLSAWQSGSQQEMLNGSSVGNKLDPNFSNPGGGVALGNANLLNTLTAYRTGLAMQTPGVNLILVPMTWDPYSFGNDSFLSKHFARVPTDFYGNAITSYSGIGINPGTVLPSGSPLLNPAVFDWQTYASLNPDLTAAGLTDQSSLTTHWLNSGVTEGRRASLSFDAPEYLARYSDLIAAYGATGYSQAISHYISSGISQGRMGSIATDPLVFDWHTYSSLNSDLGTAGLTDQMSLTSHWLNHGINEGRRAQLNFDAPEYISRYTDLLNAFGATGYSRAISHYITEGLPEGRMGAISTDPQVFEWYAYKSFNTAVTATGITDQNSLTLHWLNTGIQQGLRASLGFDAPEYLRRYPDLANAFGATGYTRAISHYITNGISEGRIGSITLDPLVFNWQTYEFLNSDLPAAGLYDPISLACHWISDGISEGRQASTTFSAPAYLNRYPDLQAQLGATNYLQALFNFLLVGYPAGRNGAP